MDKKILIPLENSAADRAILQHIRFLAKLTGASLLLMRVAAALQAEGFEVSHVLAMGEPSDEIVKFTRKHKVDLIAMSTHGHRFISDLLYGSTADKVRHLVDVPVLPLKAKS